MLKPLNDNVLVKAQDDKINASGIVMPDTLEQDKPVRGEIIDVGSTVNAQIKSGMKIIFKKYAPDEVEDNKEKFLILNEKDILAYII